MLTAVAGLHSDAALAARAAGRAWLAGETAAVGLVAQCYRAVRARAAGRSGPTPVAGRPRCGPTGPHKKKNVCSLQRSSRAIRGRARPRTAAQCLCASLSASARCEYWLTDSLCDSINPVVHLRSAQSGTIGQFESPPPAQVTVCRLTVTLTTLQCERLLPSTNHSDCSPESPPRDADNKVE